MAVAKAGRNPYLSRCYGALLDEGRRFLHMHFDYLESSSAEELLTPEHYDIVDAIKEMDADRADRLAHQHTRQFHDRFMHFMRANGDCPRGNRGDPDTARDRPPLLLSSRSFPILPRLSKTPQAHAFQTPARP